MNRKEIEKKYSWFFGSEWDKVDDMLIKANAGTRMVAALKAVHSGKSYGEAGRIYNLSKQAISQWLERADVKVNRGDLRL